MDVKRAAKPPPFINLSKGGSPVTALAGHLDIVQAVGTHSRIDYRILVTLAAHFFKLYLRSVFQRIQRILR